MSCISEQMFVLPSKKVLLKEGVWVGSPIQASKPNREGAFKCHF